MTQGPILNTVTYSIIMWRRGAHRARSRLFYSNALYKLLTYLFTYLRTKSSFIDASSEGRVGQQANSTGVGRNKLIHRNYSIELVKTCFLRLVK